jgi:hypothetical protein
MTDQELLALMPETMRDEFSYAARVCSDATGGKVKPGIFHVALNIVALEYARAVLGAADAKPTSLEAAQRPQDKLDRLIEMDRTATDHFPDIKKMVTTSLLVDRVADALMESIKGQGSMARVAILEVAAWLRTESEGHLGSGLHWAKRLEQEANR